MIKTLQRFFFFFAFLAPHYILYICLLCPALQTAADREQTDVLSSPEETQPMWMLLFKEEVLGAVWQGGGGGV